MRINIFYYGLRASRRLCRKIVMMGYLADTYPKHGMVYIINPSIHIPTSRKLDIFDRFVRSNQKYDLLLVCNNEDDITMSIFKVRPCLTTRIWKTIKYDIEKLNGDKLSWSEMTRIENLSD